MIVLEVLGCIVILGFMAFFAFMGAHVSEEQRQGRNIPLPWEKKEEDDE